MSRLQRMLLLMTVLLALVPLLMPRWEYSEGTLKADAGRAFLWDRPAPGRGIQTVLFAELDAQQMLIELAIVLVIGTAAWIIAGVVQPPTLRREIAERARKTGS